MQKVATEDGQQSPLDFAVAAQQRETLNLVRKAVEARRVVLAFQPVVQANRPGEVAFYEGLARIIDTNGRIIPARDFIEAAETHETGRMIDCVALELGLRTLAEQPALRLSINMSARSIGYPRWMRTLEAGLALDPTIAERLILEITESSAMVVPDIVSVFIEEMHTRGIAFALDDFGAGYTAFRFFKEFFFDVLKIDGQFIRGIHASTDNQVLTKALISIARHFEMFTVAESVECAEDAAYLASIGIDCMQGYYFGAPSTAPAWETRRAVNGG